MVETTQETRVTTETVDLYICPSCDQRYEKAAMVSVGFGVVTREDESTGSFEKISMLCENCTQSLFDYEGAHGTVPEHELESLGAPDPPSDAPNRGLYGIAAAWFAFGSSFFVLSGGTPIMEYIGGGLLFLSWIAIPLTILYDIDLVSATGEWDPNEYVWVGASMVFFLNVFVVVAYLVRRYMMS